MERGACSSRVDAFSEKSGGREQPLRFPDDVSGSGRNAPSTATAARSSTAVERFVVADDDADFIPDDKIQIGVDARH